MLSVSLPDRHARTTGLTLTDIMLPGMPRIACYGEDLVTVIRGRDRSRLP
jgi:hypothetical protein